DLEQRPGLVGVNEPDVAAVQLGDGFGDGQAEARAGAGAGAVGAVEAVEDVRLRLGGDAAAGIAHGDDVAAVFRSRGDLDAAAGRRELQRVVEKVEQHAANELRVAAHRHRAVRGGGEGDAFGRGQSADGAGGVIDDFAQREID